MDNKTVRRRKLARVKNPQTPNGSPEHNARSVLGRIWAVTCIVLAALSLLLAVAYWRSPINAVEVDDVVDVLLTGKFQANKGLSTGVKIPGLVGAECIEEDGKGNLYTGLLDGRIVKVARGDDGTIGAGKVEAITAGVFPDVKKTSEDLDHARPLGFRIRDGVLYMVDAMYGFYSVNLESGKVEFLVKPDDTKPRMVFPNDVDITADGRTAYFTDSSATHAITKLGYIFLEGKCDGRLFEYNFSSKRLRTVVDGLCFANGVQLSRDQLTLLVPETTKLRVKYFDTKTWKVKRTVHLPVMPDNLRMTSRGTYWVAGANVPSKVTRVINQLPTLRQILAGMTSHDNMMTFIHNFVRPDHAVAVEVNDDGEVLRVLQDPGANLIYALSQVVELSDGRMALGSYSSSMSIATVL